MTIYSQTLPEPTERLVKKLSLRQPAFLKDFYLSGGTGLALQLGHRESQDLDFFSEKPFESESVVRELSHLGRLDQTQLEAGTINTYLDEVKLQFLEYPYPILNEVLAWQGIKISSISDIAATKIITIAQRGSKKDFVDLYFILKKYQLNELLGLVTKKYQRIDYDLTHLLKSLVYFEDAEHQPMPRLFDEVEWTEIKSTVVDAVKSISLT